MSYNFRVKLLQASDPLRPTCNPLALGSGRSMRAPGTSSSSSPRCFDGSRAKRPPRRPPQKATARRGRLAPGAAVPHLRSLPCSGTTWRSAAKLSEALRHKKTSKKTLKDTKRLCAVCLGMELSRQVAKITLDVPRARRKLHGAPHFISASNLDQKPHFSPRSSTALAKQPRLAFPGSSS